MKASHLHLKVTDLPGTLTWFEKILEIKPQYQNPHMASLPFGPLTLILDIGETGAETTLAFDVEDCEQAVAKASSLGAEILSQPVDQPWGVRAAYLKGPGAIVVEFEQRLPR